MRSWKRTLLIAAAAALFAVAAFHYMGFSYYYKYQTARKQAKSIESGFPELEHDLKMAVRFYRHPVFQRELGRLYLEMALAENAFGTPEKRDSYLDRAVDTLSRAIKENPLEASAFFDQGRAYLFYNNPVPIYQDKARRFLRRALGIEPADEFLNTNVLFFFLTQWDSLDESEKEFVNSRLSELSKNNPACIEAIRKVLKKSFGSSRLLDDRL